MAFPTLSDIQQVDWGKTNLWDIKFSKLLTGTTYTESLPPPFDDWFPAISVNEPVFNLSDETFSTSVADFVIPKRITSTSMTIQFYDAEDCRLRQWFERWAITAGFRRGYEGSGGLVVSPMAQFVMNLKVMRLGPDLKEGFTKEYLVYPSGTLIYQGNSQSDAVQFSVNLSVVYGCYKAANRYGISSVSPTAT